MKEPIVVQMARGYLEDVRARAAIELRHANQLWASPRPWDHDEARRIEARAREDIKNAEEALARTLANNGIEK